MEPNIILHKREKIQLFSLAYKGIKDYRENLNKSSIKKLDQIVEMSSRESIVN